MATMPPIPLDRSMRPGGYSTAGAINPFAPAAPNGLAELLAELLGAQQENPMAAGLSPSVPQQGATQQVTARMDTRLPPERNPYGPRDGIGGALGWSGNPIYRAFEDSGIKDSLAYGLATGTNFSDGLAMATIAQIGGRNEREDRAAKAAEWSTAQGGKRKLLDTLTKYGDDFADIAEGLASGAVDTKDAWTAMFKRQADLKAQAATSATNRGNATFLKDPTLKAAVESGAMSFADALKMERGGANGTDYGMTPIWGQFRDGSFGYGVQGSDGNFHPVDTGDFTPMDPRTLSTERAAGLKLGAGEGNRTLEAPIAAQNVEQLNAKTAHVQDVIDKAISQVAWDSTGMIGQVMGTFGGTKAYDLRKTAQTVKANLGFAELQAMRDSSPTGGALGSIAVQELEALQSTLESLDPNQSDAQLADNLKTIKVLLDRQKQFRQRAYEAKYGAYDGQSPAQAPAAPAGGLPHVVDQAGYAALPSGAQYIAPDGTTRTKP